MALAAGTLSRGGREEIASLSHAGIHIQRCRSRRQKHGIPRLGVLQRRFYRRIHGSCWVLAFDDVHRCMRGVCCERVGNLLPIHAQDYRSLDLGGVLGDDPVYLRSLQLPTGNPYDGVEPFQCSVRRVRVRGLGVIDKGNARGLVDHRTAVPSYRISGKPLLNGLRGCTRPPAAARRRRSTPDSCQPGRLAALCGRSILAPCGKAGYKAPCAHSDFALFGFGGGETINACGIRGVAHRCGVILAHHRGFTR